MKKVKKPLEDLIERYQRAIIRYLSWAKPVAGTKEVHHHIIIHDREMQPNGYVELLCRKKTGKLSMIRGEPTMQQDRCANCEKALGQLAASIANGHARELFGQSGIGGEVRVKKAEVAEAIKDLGQMLDEDAAKHEQLSLPVEMLPVGTGDFLAVPRDEVRRIRKRDKGPVAWR